MHVSFPNFTPAASTKTGLTVAVLVAALMLPLAAGATPALGDAPPQASAAWAAAANATQAPGFDSFLDRQRTSAQSAIDGMKAASQAREQRRQAVRLQAQRAEAARALGQTQTQR